MSLYIGSDNWGNRILSLTKGSHPESQHKGVPLLDAYLDTRLPYMRVVNTYGATATKKWEHNVRLAWDYEVPWQAKDAYNKGYIVLMARVWMMNRPKNSDHPYQKSAFRAMRFEGWNKIINPNTVVLQPEEDLTRWDAYQKAPHSFNCLDAITQDLASQSSVNYSWTGYVFQVTNARVINGILSFDSIPHGNQINITNKTINIGGLDMANYGALSVRPSNLDLADDAFLQYYWETGEPSKDNFLSGMGSTSLRDQLLTMNRNWDVWAFYYLVTGTPILPYFNRFSETWDPVFFGMTG